MQLIRVNQETRWADTPEAFLHQLGQATAIWVPGQDRQRTRAVCTLLHGNEPSGLRALHHWLRSGEIPAVNVLCLVPGVHIARHHLLFQHRFIPGERDLNRCFQPPFEGQAGQLAAWVRKLLETFRPECLVDIHNTSGRGPGFGVVSHENSAHEALVALFTQHLVVTDLRLGALMELSEENCPIVTVECGGAGDPRSDQLALQGLLRYVNDPRDILQLHHGIGLELYHHPLRLELTPGTQLAFANAPLLDTDFCVPLTLEQFNFGVAPPNTLVGWLGKSTSLSCLRLRSGQGEVPLLNWFYLDGQRLLSRYPLKLFMITQRVDIALSDCLLYAAPEQEHIHLNR